MKVESQVLCSGTQGKGPPPIVCIDDGFTCLSFVFHAITVYKTAFARSRYRYLEDAPQRYFDINKWLVKTHRVAHGGFSKGFNVSELKQRVK